MATNSNNNIQMRAKIIFNLDEQEDKDLYAVHCQAENMYSALWNIFHNTKKTLIHRFENTDNSNNDVFDGIESVYEEMYKILESNNVNLDILE